MKKIEYAVGAAGSFIYHMHREGFDRGMIATFSDGFRIEQDFTGNEVALHRSLARVANHTGNGSTRLYNSLEDVITRFWQAGYRDRPWLLTVITDSRITPVTSIKAIRGASASISAPTSTMSRPTSPS